MPACRARSLRSILAFLALAPALVSCADAPHREICARVLELVLPAAAEPRIASVERGPDSPNDVRIRFRPRGAFEDRELVCRFAHVRGQGLGLRAVELNGRALSPIRLFLLHRALGQAPPPELLGEPGRQPPWTLGLHLAYLAQQALNGLVIGSVIALVAVGYTMVYGITRHIQFAYGELVTIGAVTTGLFYAALWLAGSANLATMLGLALPLVIALAALLGRSIERVAFRRLTYAGTQPALIAAIGLSIFLQEFIRLSQGARSRWMPPLTPGTVELFTAGGFSVSLTHMQIVVVALAVALSLAQSWLLARSRYGRAYRAVADDPRMAALLGVDVNGVIARTYALGAALAAVAGAAIIMRYGEAGPGLGAAFGFKALTAAILGGIGSFAGALIGGLLIGLVEALWAGYAGAEWRDAAVFAVLVLVLVFRPGGLFGAAEPLMPWGGGGGPGPGGALRSRPIPPSQA
ncbi:MAG: branched-chain amino acid ABC transporter permease [Rhodospirillales bacterium]